jgi:hypothetical protein
MALTIANEVRKAALDGITALLNSGQFRLLDAGVAELAMPTFNATAFGAATTASPSVASANAFTADSSITAGTIATFDIRTSGGVSRIAGTVGVGAGDLQVADNVIPGTATSLTLSSFSLSLQLS